MRALNPGAMPPDLRRCKSCGKPKPRTGVLAGLDSLVWRVPEWGTAVALWAVGYGLTFLPVSWIGWLSAALFVGGAAPGVLAVRTEFRRQVHIAVERHEVRLMKEITKKVGAGRPTEKKEQA